MKLTRRLLSVLLAMAMVFAMAPAGMAAEETPAEPEPVATLPEEAETEDAQADAVGSTIPVIGETLALEPWVNPLYADVLDVEDLPEYEAPEKPDASVQATFVTQEEAVQKVRNFMKRRTETFVFYVNSREMDHNKLLSDILYAAMEHTGVSTEGDYLMWHLAGVVGGEVDRTSSSAGYDYTYTITLAYYTTAAQETEMTAAVALLLNQLDVEEKTDYEKVKAVYDYICANITYDYEHLEDTEYYLQFSAYAALVNKTAVCQGYAQLFYRLMLELGVDCRVITGIGGDDVSGYGPHAWNIVELDGLYYNVDSTWDAGYDEYLWFLNNTWNFVGHYRAADYETVEFHMAYPMAAEDYDPDVPGEVDPVMNYGYCGDTAIWILSREGELVITGTGAMYDYVYHTTQPDMPYWSDMYASFVTGVYVDEGITYIGDHSFYELSNVTEVVLPDSLLGMGICAFMYCTSLTSVIIPENVTEIAPYAFYGCESLANIMLPDGLTGIGEMAFYECRALDDVILPEGLTTMGKCAFAFCSSLTSIRIPDGVSSIPEDAFTCCSALVSVILPDGLTSIDFWGFHECDSLVEINLPDSLTTIGNSAFHGCDALKSIILPSGLISIGQSAFAYSGLTEIVFLGDAPSVGRYCFDGVTATAYYPANNDTWTEEVMQDYGGTITWVVDCAHEYESVVTAPTCTAQGYTTYTCTLCGHSYTDSYTEMAPHTPGEAVSENIVNATCTAKGSYDKVVYCADCGAELERETVETELLPHAYEPVVVEPTCTVGGWTTHTCVDCGDSYEDSYTEPLGHDMGPWVLIQAATCTAGGWEESTCSRCEHSETRETALAEHSYEAVVTAPTCTTQGYTTHICAVCGDSYEDSYTDALGHDCTYSVTTVPTEFKAGALTGTCAVCGHEESVELPAISEEDYEITVLQAPTDSEPGAAECVWKNTQYGEIRFEAELRPLAVPGDVNGDGEIDILDANLVVAWYNEIRDLTDKQLAAADVNGDGEVDIMDANMIVAYYNEIIDEFPAAKA